jgi:two-component system sensor histidine kinase UhpB
MTDEINISEHETADLSGFEPGKAYRILILEHDTNDLDLILYELRKSGIPHVYEVVSSRKTYQKGLREFLPDVILSDFSLPAFSGQEAFELRQRYAPEVPFIFVSGYIRQAELATRGLNDYVMKDRLSTLTVKLLNTLKVVRYPQRNVEDHSGDDADA